MIAFVALYRAFRPNFGQSGQQTDLPGMALEEHLGDPGRPPEVPIDLKRGMQVEKVQGGAVLEEGPEILVGPVGLLKACPEIHDPGPGSIL